MGIDKKQSQESNEKYRKDRYGIAQRVSGTLQAVDELLAHGPRQGAVSEKRDLETKTPNIDNIPSRLKKMKSTLPDVGKLKSEL